MFSQITKIVKNPGFFRYFKNTSWLIGEQVLRILSGVIVGIWVARYLGPSQFGTFSYALAFASIFAGIAKMGLDGIVVRDLTLHPDQKDVYVGTSFWIKLAGAFFVLALIVTILPFTSNDSLTNSYILIISLGLIFQSFEVVEFYFQSRVLARLVSICKIAQLALSSLIKIYLVLIQADLFWFVMITAIDSFSLAISYCIAYRLNGNVNFLRFFDRNLALRLLKDSWPLIISSVVVMIYMRIDQVMIKEMLGEREVGIYSAAVRLSEAWYFFPMVLTSSLFPAILNAKKISAELYYFRLQQLYNFMVMVGVAIAILTTFLGPWLVKTLFGLKYEDAGALLAVHIWTGIFVSLGVASGKWLLSENLNGLALQRTLGGMLLNIGLNFLLIPRYGNMGAAIGTLLSQSFAAYFFDVFNSRTRETFYMKTRSIFLAFIFR